jgi:RNAse (barnase) inhibitor barstar
MAIARLNGAAMTDWEAFHDECAKEFGFPDFYGRNMNAWIDCLTYINIGDGMSLFVLDPEDTLQIELADSETMKTHAPHILDELIQCVRFVNERSLAAGEVPRLELKLL